MSDLVSIIIPCYNQGEYIEETLQSVLSQTYENIEIIIINDGSTDNSEETISNLIKEKPSIQYISIVNGGVSKARNIGISKASGKFVLPLDADDIILPEYTTMAVEEFKKDPDLIVVTALGEFFGEENGPMNLPEFSMKKMLHGNIIFCPSFFKKDDWEKIGGFDEKMTHLEDWDFYIRLTNLNPEKIKRLNYTALRYRIKEPAIARNTIGFRDGSYDNTALHIYTKNKDLFFQHYGNPSLMIKEIENLKWELTKKDRELNFLKRFFPNQFLLKLRSKKYSK